VFWGILVFGEWPDGWALVGIALILASGMVLVWREAVARKSGEVDMPDRI
jgi:drug/metabolite transporter (DMT)-like permease